MQLLASDKTMGWKTHSWLLLTGLFVFLLLLLLITYINNGSFEMLFHWRGMFREGYLLLIGIITAIYFVYYTSRWIDRNFTGARDSIRRYLAELVVVIVGGIVINSLFQYLFKIWVVIPQPEDEMLETKLRNLFIVCQTLMIIVYGVITGFKAFSRLKQKQSELLILEKELAQSQFEALKNKLNPHFLFNSLSVLTSLVHSNPDIAEAFIGKLSKTYRYLLDQREKEYVPLAEEWGFLENFEFLLKQRYDKKLVIEFSREQEVRQYYLLPNTILIVVESILSTNTMSNTKPLKIALGVNNRWLIFRYQVQEKDTNSKELLDQLKRLKEQYAEMGKALVEDFDLASQTACLKIPLLQKND